MAAFSPNCIKSQFTREYLQLVSSVTTNPIDLFTYFFFNVYIIIISLFACVCYTDIFALVTYLPAEDGYRFHMYSEESVPLFGPSLPSTPIFSKAAEFREFLLVKRELRSAELALGCDNQYPFLRSFQQ